jgi:hypothetical protein
VVLLQLQLPALQPAQLAGLISAVASLRLRPKAAWLQQYMAASQYKLAKMTTGQLACCTAALAGQGMAAAQLPAKWLEAAAGQVRRQLAEEGEGQADAAQLAGLAAAWRRLGYHPPAALAAALLAASCLATWRPCGQRPAASAPLSSWSSSGS